MARILLIDDDYTLHDLVGLFLEEAGHEVRAAASGMDGLALLRKERFDLVLLDMNMPGFDGMDLLRLIRREPGLQSVPVLMCTAEERGDRIEDAFASGAAGYILKPFTRDALQAKVSRALAPRAS